METKYYIHRRIYNTFFNLCVVRGENKKVVFVIKEQEPILGPKTWDIRIPKDTRYLCDTLEEALTIIRPMLVEQVEEARKELKNVEDFLGGI